MASSISLSFHIVRIHKRQNPDVFLKLGSYVGRKDFYEFLKEFITGIESANADDRINQKFLQVKRKNFDDSDRAIKGLLMVGEYGFSSTIVNTASGSTTHDKSTNEADMIPLYFNFRIPADKTYATVCFQRFGNHGAYSALRQAMIAKFSQEHGELILDFDPLIPDSVIDEYLRAGEIKAIHFREFNVSADIADALRFNENQEKTAKIDLTISAKRNGSINLPFPVTHFLDKGKRASHKLIQATNIQYNDVSVSLEINGKTRKVNLQKHKNRNPYYEITDEIEIGTNGHPTFSSIDQIAQEWLQSFESYLGPRYHE